MADQVPVTPSPKKTEFPEVAELPQPAPLGAAKSGKLGLEPVTEEKEHENRQNSRAVDAEHLGRLADTQRKAKEANANNTVSPPKDPNTPKTWNLPKLTLRVLTLISLLVAIGFLLTPGSQNSRNNANIFLLVSFALLAAGLIYKHYYADQKGMKDAYFAHENISLLMLGLVLLGGWFYMTGKARISMRFQHEWLIPIACLLFVLVLVPFVRYQSISAKEGMGLDKVMQLILLLVVGISVVSVFAPGAHNQNTFGSGVPQWIVLGLTVLIVLGAGAYIMSSKGSKALKLPQHPLSLSGLNFILLGLFAVSLVLFLADTDVIPAQNFDTPRDVQDGINLGAFVVLLALGFVFMLNRKKTDEPPPVGPNDGEDVIDEDPVPEVEKSEEQKDDLAAPNLGKKTEEKEKETEKATEELATSAGKKKDSPGANGNDGTLGANGGPGANGGGG